jgi:hypothetical protein
MDAIATEAALRDELLSLLSLQGRVGGLTKGQEQGSAFRNALLHPKPTHECQRVVGQSAGRRVAHRYAWADSIVGSRDGPVGRRGSARPHVVATA